MRQKNLKYKIGDKVFRHDHEDLPEFVLGEIIRYSITPNPEAGYPYYVKFEDGLETNASEAWLIYIPVQLRIWSSV